MKNQKKIIIVTIITAIAVAVISAILVILGVLPVPSFLIPDDSGNNPLKKAEKIINDHPIDIMIYGKAIDFQVTIKTRALDNITEASLSKSEEASLSLLIINDISDNIQLSQSEIDLIKEYIYEKGYSLFYLGEKYINTWNNTQYIADIDGSKGVAFVNECGNIVRISGFWTVQEEAMMNDYPNILGDAIVYQIEDLIRANY